MKSEFLLVAEKVLFEQLRPMSAIQIVNYAITQKLFTDNIAGKTPHQTLKSKLSVHIRKYGDRSVFVRTDPGRFYLRRLLDSEIALYSAPPLRKPKSEESVLVFDANMLNSFGRVQGISESYQDYLDKILNSDVCFYKKRFDAEQDSSVKQVLTYVMITKNGKLLSFKRGSFNRVEDFLKGANCIGFGGHVSSDDLTMFSGYDMGITDCVIRELGEELILPKVDRVRLRKREGLSWLGVLNDDSSPAGQRHFACLFRYEVSDDLYWDHPKRGEKSITRLQWLDPEEKISPIWEFEYWSQLCLRHMFPRLISSTSHYKIRRKSAIKKAEIICVVGTIGSGKSLATKILKEKFGYYEINSGKVLSKIMDIAPVPETPRRIFQKKAWDFISKSGGCRHLANAILDEIDACQEKQIVIDGLRQIKTLNELIKSDRGKKTAIIYIHTIPDIAFNFYKKREDSKINIFDFMKITNCEVENDLEEMISISDAILYNWAGLEDYVSAIKNLFFEVGLLEGG